MPRKSVAHREDAHFRILRLLEVTPEASQREIAANLGVSLGAVNYCMRALVALGYVKLGNSRSSRNKLGYVYVLSPEGVVHRSRLAVGFIARKLAEYEALQSEIATLRDEYPEAHGWSARSAR